MPAYMYVYAGTIQAHTPHTQLIIISKPHNHARTEARTDLLCAVQLEDAADDPKRLLTHQHLLLPKVARALNFWFCFLGCVWGVD